MSNFLGSADEPALGAWRGIISGNELVAREGVDLRKGMNYRKEPQLSVFLALPSHDGEYRDEWHAESQLYVYEGHDSTTVEGRKAARSATALGFSKAGVPAKKISAQQDQIAMYPDGRLSDNGKFLKAANAYKDGIRKEPMQIQVYEKLDPGVWYDKGIFNLVDALSVKEGGRKVFKFFLRPADALDRAAGDRYYAERMLPVTAKVAAWSAARGRCEKCDSESDLHFVGTPKSVRLYCSRHAS